jgi:hypothetical protein
MGMPDNWDYWYRIIFNNCKDRIKQMVSKEEFSREEITNELFDDYDWATPGITSDALDELIKEGRVKVKLSKFRTLYSLAQS